MEGMQLTSLRYAIIGGDLRSVELASSISADGNKVSVFGLQKAEFDKCIEKSTALENTIKESDIIIGPIPFSNDNETIITSYNDEKIYINDVFKCITGNKLFFAGKIEEKILHLAKSYGMNVVDILEREEMAVLNAIPTAEGAIQIAMKELPITIHGSDVLVLGFGRVGKMLSKMLKGIGARVYTAARKYEDMAWMKGYGYHPVHIREIEEQVSKMDIIFNTIPHLIVKEKILKRLKYNCLLIDLASKPGGIDIKAASKMNIKTIWALSLPGKAAPATAADIIKQTIYNVLADKKYSMG